MDDTIAIRDQRRTELLKKIGKFVLVEIAMVNTLIAPLEAMLYCVLLVATDLFVSRCDKRNDFDIIISKSFKEYIKASILAENQLIFNFVKNRMYLSQNLSSLWIQQTWIQDLIQLRKVGKSEEVPYYQICVSDPNEMSLVNQKSKELKLRAALLFFSESHFSGVSSSSYYSLHSESAKVCNVSGRKIDMKSTTANGIEVSLCEFKKNVDKNELAEQQGKYCHLNVSLLEWLITINLSDKIITTIWGDMGLYLPSGCQANPFAIEKDMGDIYLAYPIGNVEALTDRILLDAVLIQSMNQFYGIHISTQMYSQMVVVRYILLMAMLPET
ncbi:hypothetical protein EDC96DRAFT_540892 [Choanephora cucurbitarum]|nr:hypothetical protein EDC96DRAFT_540892 [Choanephora cucurbitarum]